MDFGLSEKDVGRLLAFKPQLMVCGIEERWKPLLKYLYYLGIDRDGMRRMLVIKPMVFCVDLETTIVPKVLLVFHPSIKRTTLQVAINTIRLYYIFFRKVYSFAEI